MGFFKVLGGVALGVGAVAAAPFTGGGSVLAAASLGASLAGAGTVAAAAGAAAAGGAAAYALDEKANAANAASTQAAVKKALEEERAKNAIKVKKLEAEITNMESRFDSYKEKEKFYIGLSAIGLAIANVDGDISSEEKEDIEKFAGGEFVKDMTELQKKIDELIQSPPTFNQALTYVEEYIPPQDLEIVTLLLEVTAFADEVVTPSEKEFIAKWNAYISNQAEV